MHTRCTLSNPTKDKINNVTSDRQVSCTVGFAQVVFSKAGVLSLIRTTDIIDPQNPIRSDCYPG